MELKPYWIGWFLLLMVIAFCVGWWSTTRSGEGDSTAELHSLSNKTSQAVAGGGNMPPSLAEKYQVGSKAPQVGLARPGEVILRGKDRKVYNQILAEAGLNGATVIRSNDKLGAVLLKITDAGRFAEWATENGFEPTPNFFVYTPGVPQTESGSLEGFASTGSGLLAWLGIENRSGAGVTVAVLDSGISTHPTFDSSEIIRMDGAGQSYENGHGTAVASIIAGVHPQAPGVAPGVTLMDFPVLNEQGIGDTFLLADMIMEAADSGARVINLSLGATGDSPLVREAVAYAQAQDIILVAAAGNEGLGQLSLPAYLPGVVAVGSVDANGQILPFSNRGDGLDVVAPGYEVQAAWPDQQLIQMTGTSGSVPIVTGALATLFASEPDLSAVQAVEILQQYSNEAGVAGVDVNYGYGVLDLDRMLNRNQSGIYDVAVTSQYLDPTQTGQLQVVVQNQGTEPLYGIHVKTVSSGVPSNQFVQQLQPGEVAVLSQRVVGQNQDELEITTTLSGSYTDGEASNDVLKTVISSQ